MQCACAILSSAACPAVPCSSTLPQKNGMIFRENVIEHKMCVSNFSTILTKIFPILRIIQLDITINVHRSSRKVHVILFRFHPGDFRKVLKTKFHENPSGGSRVIFQAEGRTDTTKLTVVSSNLAKAPIKMNTRDIQ
jgi:hypothetical protein